MSLKVARQAGDEVKGWLAEGLDPGLENGRRDDRIRQARLDTFEAVAEEFIDKITDRVVVGRPPFARSNLGRI